MYALWTNNRIYNIKCQYPLDIVADLCKEIKRLNSIIRGDPQPMTDERLEKLKQTCGNYHAVVTELVNEVIRLRQPISE